MRALVVTMALVVIPYHAPAQTTAQQSPVPVGARAAVTAFVLGLQNGNADAIAPWLHETASVDTVTSFTLAREPATAAALLRGRPQSGAKVTVETIDTTHYEMYARITRNWPTPSTTDYLALLRTGADWKIVAITTDPGTERQVAGEEAGIRTAIHAYLRALTHFDRDSLSRAFHESAFISTSANNATRIQRSPFTIWRGFTEGTPPHDHAEMHNRILSIDHSGKQAVVKVDLDWPSVHYIDYMFLARIGDEWRITNKIWFGEPGVRALTGVKDLALPPGELSAYSGSYHTDMGALKIVVVASHLEVQLPDGNAIRLLAQGNHEFALASSPADRVKFVFLNGQVTHFELRQGERLSVIRKTG